MSKLGLESGDRGEVSEYHLSWNNFNASLVTFVKDISPHQVYVDYHCVLKFLNSFICIDS